MAAKRAAAGALRERLLTARAEKSRLDLERERLAAVIETVRSAEGPEASSSISEVVASPAGHGVLRTLLGPIRLAVPSQDLKGAFPPLQTGASADCLEVWPKAMAGDWADAILSFVGRLAGIKQ